MGHPGKLRMIAEYMSRKDAKSPFRKDFALWLNESARIIEDQQTEIQRLKSGDRNGK